MQIILLQDVDKVGLRGEVVDVARGYARNYLLPRRLAETATPAKVRELERREAQRARHEARSTEQAREVATKLGQIELRFDVKAGPTGVLFGSVTPTDIADGIWSTAKVRIDRRKIDLPGVDQAGRPLRDPDCDLRGRLRRGAGARHPRGRRAAPGGNTRNDGSRRRRGGGGRCCRRG